ncbi:SDR family oxidoreductase [Roseobacter sp. HKCCD9010]|uniref:SDR family oxidoreductase n=1 Tax=unclassified Roseobacter TaxID=196798 RepID=UPI001491180E|nr:MULTISPECIES: SDR family oxidoreductase [unclassified Roseobacter]MBF9052295.1 SDR family oxidoreductase [Rhodobacterales bacterium HKCCD4356]NNV14262.1 SDR family oxidoreductase [Roseobacter sp. HKCCD7357]NNV18455.1 SDR family oxidoreductase [Roseobacter sp. HKCCD8768]NNV27895.1 SDR family oxidoreductase [Roseobacter sp. HKCCD8192]NNV32187.1 SDR family oxidoreductase [Roseobacter sp. HKCCD9061]
MTSLAGKTCLITAAGQGIGWAASEAFVAAGATVWATDLNEDAVNSIDGAEGRRLDVTDPAAITAIAEETGPIDVLFNCAGFVHAGNILDCPEEDWDFAFDLNAKAQYRLIQTNLPGMLEKGGGSIINMSSVASSVKGVPNRLAYSASKAAVIGLTKAVAADFVTQGIRCNAICPGTVESPSLHDRLRATGNYENALTEFIARQPMGRIGKTEEIASLAVYLASDASAFTTGQCHIIDGGWAI